MGNTMKGCAKAYNAEEGSKEQANAKDTVINGAMRDIGVKGGAKNDYVKAARKFGSTQTQKWQNSNIGEVGGDRDKELRKTAAETEEEFRGAGEKLGLEIWRVEKFQPKRQALEGFPGFYDGDSYIVLHTYQLEGEAKYRWDLFFWLGSESTQDEKGAAAYFTVNIDDMLDTFPVQYRETQGNETDAFKALFNGHVKVLKGGIDSGFTEGGVAFTADPSKTTFSANSNDVIGKNLTKKLFKISDEDTGNIVVTQVDEGTTVSKSEITEDDPYMMVVGSEAAYIYSGTGCSVQERLYVMDAAAELLKIAGVDENTQLSFVNSGNEPPQWQAYVV
ncbi:hypothetical protein NDN08_001967 [Rhodosorus marinus]|uniref:Gelsolin-like domain-containing protein n=1 Tax=Rhodosorus marinus TaxID=101924 RepID=A0AAV8USD4_9RHOD|nr:hypothetical protein NDN08_001967 [Rhodosorus marinus]